MKTLIEAKKAGIRNLRRQCQKAGINHKNYSDEELWAMWWGVNEKAEFSRIF